MTSRCARAVLTALVLAPLAASAADVWVASATEKIRPDTQARPVTEARIAAARNEFEAFQVVVTGPASNVTARVSALEGPGRLDDVKLYRVDLMNVTSSSSLDGGTGRWPDALVPDVDDVVGEQRNAFPFSVAGGESRAIWVEVRVPPDAAPGVYSGTVTIASAEGEARVPVTFTVWDITLPATSSLRTHFGLGYGTLARGHGLTGDGDAELRARYGAFGLDHRISVSGIWDDGFHGNFAHFDRFYRPLVDGTAQTRLPGARMTTAKYVGSRTSADEVKRWAQKARAEGWFDALFDYTCDEPPLTCSWDEINARTNVIHSADAEMKTLVTTQIWEADSHGVTNGIDIIVPVVNWMDDKPGSEHAGNNRPKYDGFLSSSPRKELWLYQSCMSHGCGGTVNFGSPSASDQYYTGWPTYMIDSSAVRNRAMEWISFLENATGELYWEASFAIAQRGISAWDSQWDFSGNGDGTLFYPGTPAKIGGQTHIPVASIRLKMIREGMEDYEYLKMLADLGHADEAKAIARDLFPAAYETEVAPEKVMAAREALAMQILVRTHKELPAAASSTPFVEGGGCGSAGGFGSGALLVFPALLGMALRRRRAAK